MRGCLPMVNQLLDNSQKNVMKSISWRDTPKIRGTLTTTREKKRNESNDLGQKRQN